MPENRAMVARQPAGEIDLIRSIEDAAKIADFIARSKLFACNNAAEAFVKILAGREMGFGPMESMASINIIEGKTSPGADLIAKAMRRKGSGYDFDVNEISDDACKISFYRIAGDGTCKEMGRLRYTYEEAKSKGWNLTQKGTEKMTWRTKTANMLFARVITDGKRFFCPDVLTSAFDQDEIDSPTFRDSIPVEVVAAGNATPQPVLNGQIPNAADSEQSTTLIVNPDGTLTDDLDAITATRSRVESLIVELGFTAGQVRKKLQRDYGGAESTYQVNDLALLNKLESELLAAKSKRQSKNNVTAAATA